MSHCVLCDSLAHAAAAATAPPWDIAAEQGADIFIADCGAPEQTPAEQNAESASTSGKVINTWQLSLSESHQGPTGEGAGTAAATAWRSARVTLAEGGPPPLRVGAVLGCAGEVAMLLHT